METDRKKEVANLMTEKTKQTDILTDNRQTDRQTAELTLLKIWEMLKEHMKGQVWVKDWIRRGKQQI